MNNKHDMLHLNLAIVVIDIYKIRNSVSYVHFKKDTFIIAPGEHHFTFDYRDVNGIIQMAYVREFSSTVHYGIFISTDLWENKKIVSVMIHSDRSDTVPVTLGCSAWISNK